ncbi:MAG: 4-alpha-glucanotransferase [Nitrospirales bacterium]|nr:MAG: 4-alpha-glucanotransferase [Nitrospirales bacterium]
MGMTMYGSVQQADVFDLASRYGMASAYTDGIGSDRTMTPDALALILTAMGVPSTSQESIQHSMEHIQGRTWRQVVDDVQVIEEGTRRPALALSLPLESQSLGDVWVSWTITDEHSNAQAFSRSCENCQLLEETVIDGKRYVRVSLPLQASLALGYYWVSFSISVMNQSLNGKTFVIVAPRQCYTPDTPSRCVGLSVQLYNVRTAKNWGIGDFRDLKGLLRWSRNDLQVATVGISPLHDPTVGVISPYSPSSRLFINPLYLDLEAIPEFRSSSAVQRHVAAGPFQHTLHQLRSSQLVQYEKVKAVKFEILEQLYQVFKQQHVQAHTARFRAFEQYRQRQGSYLELYSLFQVLSEHFHTSAWRQWPEAYHLPHAPQVQAFLHTCADRIQKVQYVQWQCEEQMAGLDRTAKRLNLAFRMYHDLPVGVHPDGADAWMFQDEFASGITLGAPPDSINHQGQNWGLMAPVPWHMRAAGYRLFIETLRRNMQFGGMLRIDHALGLFRLFVIPEGHTGDGGTYVQTHVDEVLGILALESVRHRVMVIGEDLGTVTPEIRARLTKSGILSYRLMPFEQESTGKFRAPKHYPQQAMVSFTTHDLPTCIGYWAGRDIEVKARAGLYATEQQIEKDCEARMRDRVGVLEALVEEGLLPKEVLSSCPLEAPYVFVKAVYSYLARTPCRLLMIPLEDLLGESDAPNLPGAQIEAYPSWQLRLTPSLESCRRRACIRSFMQAIHPHRA